MFNKEFIIEKKHVKKKKKIYIQKDLLRSLKRERERERERREREREKERERDRDRDR